MTTPVGLPTVASTVKVFRSMADGFTAAADAMAPHPTLVAMAQDAEALRVILSAIVALNDGSKKVGAIGAQLAELSFSIQASNQN